MNNRPANQLIPELLKELQSLIKELKNNSATISRLELDLMKDKIRLIYDNLCDVKIQEPPIKQTETETQPIFEVEPTRVEEQKPEISPEPVLEIEDEIELEAGSSIANDTKEQPPPKHTPEPLLNLFEEQIPDPVENNKKSIGEKIASAKPVESIGEAIQSKKIVNLKLAIGINEKFFFLNELFEGKMNEYNDTIEMLDQKDTIKDAIEYLVLVKENKNWEEESEAYMQLKGFLERKFN